MTYQFSYKNHPLSYTKNGTGPVVVLLHGFGEDSTIWDEQVSYLQQHCQVIVPDIPGSGASAPLHSQPESNIEDYAAAIYALLQHEQVTSCTFLGHSMGGYITLAMAEKYPAIINGFGMVHSTAFADSDEKKANRQRGIEMMEQYGGAAFLKTTIPNLFGADYKAKNTDKINSLIEKSTAFSTLSLQQYYHAMMIRPDRTSVLKNSPVPVLFIMGTEDVAAPFNDVLKQSSLPNSSYIHVLKQVGHMGMWEATATVNSYLLHFIRAVN
ncbi:Pimeloyl-ACP methyl ester carboxylesterase [Filimonas lacunae]|uniref:Pimeloyl-ACP methyl ester carboxylesterase n=1 Tax=Filimonas lacunae TaxID=477680 RepID=A0A173M9H9_9BACT|nr:alpha/beta hydrolase [Filimonas lacunae]BAV04197.1 alpha/beta hydrolase fold [Filimonas lacunae]SIT14342.1 Pimeloyl-ACP methyl ester carboxylesterase [Filimonas lacunae]